MGYNIHNYGFYCYFKQLRMSLLISTEGRILTSLRFYSRMDKADTGGHCREGEVRGDQLVTVFNVTARRY